MVTRKELESRIVAFWENADIERRCDSFINMAVNSPELCFDLMMVGKRPESEYSNPFKGVDVREYYMCSRAMPIRDFDDERSPENEVEQFINMCIRSRTEKDWSLQRRVEDQLRYRFGSEAVHALRYLLSRVDDDVVREFAYACMPPDVLAKRATVDIVVKRIESEGMMHGNTGRYLIYACKGDETIRLKFTHQPSAVFYLMHLVDHCKRDHDDDIVDLRQCKDAFMTLYKMVYDVTADDLNKRYSDLLFREDYNGNIRAGRANEIIYDISKTLAKAFEAYDESYFPYALKARKHLTVSRERIHFDDDAQELLGLEFRKSGFGNRKLF